MSYDRPCFMDSRPAAILQSLVPIGSRGAIPFYNLSYPSPRPRPPVCAGLSGIVLSLCFGAELVSPRLALSLDYPSCYPSPVLIASSNASSPHSSCLWALSAVRCRCARGRATLVLARNRSSALVALGSPKSRPCGCYSAAVGFITPSSSRSL